LLALIAKGDALYAMGDRETARATYCTAVAIDPKSAAAQLGLGRTLAQSDPGAAATAFLAVIAQEPDNVVALSDLGVAYDLQGRHAEAQTAYRRALVVAPETTDVRINLGLSLALSGSKDEAVRVLQEVAVTPGAAEDLRKELAGAFAMAGDESSARQILSEGFVRTAPKSPAYSVAGDVSLSVSHQAMANGSPQEPALGSPLTSVVVDHQPSDGVIPAHQPPVMTTSAAAPSVAHAQPDLLHVPATILTAPAIPVTRISQQAPPRIPHLAQLDASDVPSSVVDAAALPEFSQLGIPLAVTQKPDVVTTTTSPAEYSAVPTRMQIMPSTAAVAGARAPNRLISVARLAAGRQSGIPERAAYVQLASLYSAEDAQFEWRRLNRRMPDLLSGYVPTIAQADAHGQTFWCLRTFGFPSLAEATALCSRILGASGLRCWARAAS
jgi:Flp pilus assembly protein TadD